jgi:hypothetical protein
MKSLPLLILVTGGLAISKTAPSDVGEGDWTTRSAAGPRGDIIIQNAAGGEVPRFKVGGRVIANPKLKPDDAARAVLSAIYGLAPRYFCRNPDDPPERPRQ